MRASKFSGGIPISLVILGPVEIFGHELNIVRMGCSGAKVHKAIKGTVHHYVMAGALHM